MDDFEGLRTSVEEVTANMVGTVRELELEAEAEAMTELLQSHKTWADEKLQRKWFLGKESTPGETAVKIIEMTTMDLGYYINLVDKAEAGFGRLTSILKEVLLWVKCHQTLHRNCSWESQLIHQTLLLS